jgi:hypothetical protein
VQGALERVEDLRPGAQPLGEAGRADRHDHELLEVDLVVSVRAAVEHVHHRHGQHVRCLAAEVAPERQPGLGGRRLGRRQRHAQDRVGAEPALVGRAVALEHGLVDGRLVGRVDAAHGLGQLARGVGDSLRDTLAAPGVAAVAQLDRLELTGRRPRRHRRPPCRTRLQQHVHLDGRVAAAVHDLPRVHLVDLAQAPSTSSLNLSAA